MAPELIIAAVIQSPGQIQGDVRRQLMHEHPLLTNAEIDRLVDPLGKIESRTPSAKPRGSVQAHGSNS